MSGVSSALQSVRGCFDLPGYAVTRTVVDGRTREITLEQLDGPVRVFFQTDETYGDIRVRVPLPPPKVKKWQATVVVDVSAFTDDPSAGKKTLDLGLFNTECEAVNCLEDSNIPIALRLVSQVEVDAAP